MPNWCECDLYVSGPDKDVSAFLAMITKNNGTLAIDCATLVPVPVAICEQVRLVEQAQRLLSVFPEESKNIIVDQVIFYSVFCAESDYLWRLDNWGTSWEAFDVDIVYRHPGMLKLGFQLPWDPPCPLMLAISRRFRSLQFKLRYFEGGMCFQGTYVVKDNVVIRDTDGDYHGPRGG
jgi:hypothetical protein